MTLRLCIDAIFSIIDYAPLYPEADTLVLAPVVTFAQKIAVAVVG